jgi:hypothetical protein
MDSMQASKDKKLDNNNNNKFILYKSIRILFYCTLLLFILLINISAGLFTSSSIEIKNNLQIEDFKFGLFFLFSSIGKIIGSLLFFVVNKLNNRKILLISIAFFNSIIYFNFFFSNNYLIFSPLKLIIGITDMLIQIYTPMWIQQFGINKYKLGLTSIIQFCNPLGKCLAFLINYHLAYAIIFKIEAIIFAVVFIMFIGIPNKYSAKNILIIIENDTGEEMYDKKTNIAMYTLSDYNLEQSQKSFPLIDKNDDKKEKDIDMNLNINELIEQNGNKKIIIQSHKIPFCGKLKIILKNKIFMLSLLIRVILIGIETTLSLWIPDILIKLIEIKRESSLNLFGNILIIITPPLGSFITRMMGPFTIIGNKRKRNTVVLLIFFYISSALISLMIPEDKSFSFIASIIIFLFISSTCLPMLQGICLSSISKKVKENILSFIHIFTLFIGTGIMPSIFGFFYEIKEKNRIQVIKYFLYTFLGFAFLFLPFLIYLIYKQDFIEERSSIKGRGFSIDSKNGGEGIVEELGNAFGEELPNIKKKKKAQLKSIDI